MLNARRQSRTTGSTHRRGNPHKHKYVIIEIILHSRTFRIIVGYIFLGETTLKYTTHFTSMMMHLFLLRLRLLLLVVLLDCTCCCVSSLTSIVPQPAPAPAAPPPPQAGSGTLTIGDMAAMQDKLNQPDGPCRKGQMASDADKHNMTRAQADEYCVGRYQCAGYSIQAPFSTCPSKSNTTIFVVHFSDAWGARRINGDANWSSWVVPGARPPPPPPPTPPIPPNPCPDDVTNSARTKTPLYFIYCNWFLN